jgi:hypothetical protein
MRVAEQTIANFIEKASRLYEQERNAVLAATALEMYVRRWVRWVRGGLTHGFGMFAISQLRRIAEELVGRFDGEWLETTLRGC